MIGVEVRTTIDEPWLSLAPVRIGHVPPTLSTPAAYLAVLRDEVPLMRVDFYPPPEEPLAPQRITVWSGWVVLARGERVYLVHLETRESSEVVLGSYFSELWPDADFLLVASAQHVFRIGPSGQVEWRSHAVGLDGVVLKGVSNGAVLGEGEWNPPGDWRAFRLSVASGGRITMK